MFKSFNIYIKQKSIKIIIKILIITLILSLTNTVIKNYVFGQTPEEQQQQKIKDERQANQKKIDETNKKEQDYLNQLDTVENQLLSNLSELKDLNDKLVQAKNDVDKTNIDLINKEEDLNQINNELNEKTKILNQRIVFIYKNGNRNILELLFKAEGFIDFISRLKMLYLIARQDVEIIHEIKDKKDAELTVKNAKLSLITKQKSHEDDILKLITQSEQKKADIEKLYNQKKDLLSEARADKNALIAMQKQLEAEEDEITKKLEGYKYGIASSFNFIWPVTGPITSGFGWRIHPIFHVKEFHQGIDIAAPNYAPIKAVNNGQVIQAGYEYGYGNVVFIYHGSGLVTTYSHLSRILVEQGQIVSKGQIIGLEGSTGWSTGPHLLFEVRINGVAQDPLKFLE